MDTPKLPAMAYQMPSGLCRRVLSQSATGTRTTHRLTSEKTVVMNVCPAPLMIPLLTNMIAKNR